MDEMLSVIDRALVSLIERDNTKLEECLQMILQMATTYFPGVISSYMAAEMLDKIDEVPNWVSLYEEITNIDKKNDGFDLYDLLYNKLYKMIEDYVRLKSERNITVI